MNRFCTNYKMNSYTILWIDIIEIIGTLIVNVRRVKNEKDDFMPID